MTESKKSYERKCEVQGKVIEDNAVEFELKQQELEKQKDTANKKEAYLSDTINDYRIRTEQLTAELQAKKESIENLVTNLDTLQLSYEAKSE